MFVVVAGGGGVLWGGVCCCWCCCVFIACPIIYLSFPFTRGAFGSRT